MIRHLLIFLALISLTQIATAERLPIFQRGDNQGKMRVGPGHSFVKATRQAVPAELQPQSRAEDEDEDWAEVTFDFQYDENRYELCSCDIFFNNPILGSVEMSQADQYRPNIYLPTAEPATICAVFYDFTVDYYTVIEPFYTYVVIEDYYATKDDVIEINPEMATKTIEFSSYLPDGEKVKLPTLTIDEDWNEDWDFSGANTYYIMVDQVVYFDGIGSPSSILAGGINCVVAGRSTEKTFDIRITDVSDRVILGQARYIVPWDGNYYDVVSGEVGQLDIMYIEARGTESLSVSNPPSGYKHYDGAGLFEHTPAFKESNIELYPTRVLPFTISPSGKSNPFVLELNSMKKYPDFWACKSNADDPLYKIGAVAALLEYDWWDDEYWMREQNGIYSPPIVLTDEGFEYVNSANFPYMGEMRPTANSSAVSKVWPGSVYNFPADDQSVVFGSSFPVNITYIQEMRTQYGHPVFVYQPHFVGTAGELRTSDLSTLKLDLKYNGETQCDWFEDLYYWVGMWAMDDHEPGIISAEFTNTNYEFAGVKGANATVITYDEHNEDKFAPSLEMLRLLNAEGQITQTFTNDNLGTIQFSAGDFNCTGSFFKEYPLAEVKISVAPYNTGEFTGLTAAKNEEYSSTVSGFGAFFEADMKPIKDLQHEGMYDLQIELADESGNTMVQTISPAFGVGELSGISAAAGDNDVTVWASGKTINVHADGRMTVRIYSLEGVTVADTTADTTASFEMDNRGAYIVTVVAENGMVAKRKIVL